MRDSRVRAETAEAEIRRIAKEAMDAVSSMAARSIVVEAALRVIMKHGLLDEFSHEINHPSADPTPSAPTPERPEQEP
jgi:hypothetical protein